MHFRVLIHLRINIVCVCNIINIINIIKIDFFIFLKTIENRQKTKDNRLLQDGFANLQYNLQKCTTRHI
jgi:hypothetical protein